LIWPKDGCASIAYAATAAGRFENRAEGQRLRTLTRFERPCETKAFCKWPVSTKRE
jgi:hypothetical protein